MSQSLAHSLIVRIDKQIRFFKGVHHSSANISFKFQLGNISTSDQILGVNGRVNAGNMEIINHKLAVLKRVIEKNRGNTALNYIHSLRFSVHATISGILAL